jgi:hypothetical protein
VGDFHLAQLNIGRAKGPVGEAWMAEFMELLDPINALADRSPGFVWRLQDDAGNATSFRPYEDERMIVNMSVWESVEALWRFVYDSEHLDVMRRRREWFERFESLYMVLWWVPAGHIPSIDEAKERLALLEERGPTPDAFTFKVRFEAPEDGASPEPAFDEREGCPA